jgi:TolB protein
MALSSWRDGNVEIYILNLGDLRQNRLTNNASLEFGPTWSPDGTRLAFTSGRDGNSEIFLANLDGSKQTNLTNSPAGDSNPTWQP